MLIQKILFPSVNSAPDTALFFRNTAEIPCDENQVTVKAGETISLESYFNSFSIGKWKKYTSLCNLTLKLEITGEAQVKAVSSIGWGVPEGLAIHNEEEMYAAIGTKRTEIPVEVTNDEGMTIHFTELPEEGILYVELTAQTDLTLTGGAYYTQVEESKLSNVNLALGICTFKREKEIQRNVGLIIHELIENPASPLYSRARVFISDNGHTLTKEQFGSECVHVFENLNAGGAGGFTRTMIESVHRSGEEFTHIILMDDDIELYPVVIERTYCFLTMIKEEWKRAVVGGAMLELEKRYQQFESGANFTGINLDSYNHGWDLRKAEVVAANEALNPINYTGWWYCCIPTQNIRELGLPLPQFIHYDDIEYGVRNAKYGTILMNGLCVWHPYGLNKQPVSMNYYDIRNVMIAQAGLPGHTTPLKAWIRFMGTIWTETLRYRYNSAECFFLGIEDYYKGPEYFMQIEPVSNHQRIMKHNDVYEEPTIDLNKVENIGIEGRPAHCVVWGALCWFLPSRNEERYIGLRDTGVPFRTRRLYFYDENRKKGFWMEKNFGIFWKNVGRSLKDGWIILTKHNKMVKAYEAAKPVYTSLEFWENYLHLNE